MSNYKYYFKCQSINVQQFSVINKPSSFYYYQDDLYSAVANEGQSQRRFLLHKCHYLSEWNLCSPFPKGNSSPQLDAVVLPKVSSL